MSIFLLCFLNYWCNLSGIKPCLIPYNEFHEYFCIFLLISVSVIDACYYLGLDSGQLPIFKVWELFFQIWINLYQVPFYIFWILVRISPSHFLVWNLNCIINETWSSFNLHIIFSNTYWTPEFGFVGGKTTEV